MWFGKKKTMYGDLTTMNEWKLGCNGCDEDIEFAKFMSCYVSFKKMFCCGDCLWQICLKLTSVFVEVRGTWRPKPTTKPSQTRRNQLWVHWGWQSGILDECARYWYGQVGHAKSVEWTHKLYNIPVDQAIAKKTIGTTMAHHKNIFRITFLWNVESTKTQEPKWGGVWSNFIGEFLFFLLFGVGFEYTISKLVFPSPQKIVHKIPPKNLGSFGQWLGQFMSRWRMQLIWLED